MSIGGVSTVNLYVDGLGGQVKPFDGLGWAGLTFRWVRKARLTFRWVRWAGLRIRIGEDPDLVGTMPDTDP